MLTQTRAAHNCKTTFVGGVNPFIASAAFAPVPELKPQEPKHEQCYGSQPTLQVSIFALLADGKPRKALDIALEIDRKHKSVENKLWELAKSGVICSTLESRACVRPVPFYSIWGTE